ncbi:MAG: pyrroloquinoline quinone biosynthesis protein PqqE, partial [Mesorhizobium sp.]
VDWGGCRCQALAIVGNAAATDPACIKSTAHARMAALVGEARRSNTAGDDAFMYRRIGS